MLKVSGEFPGAGEWHGAAARMAGTTRQLFYNIGGYAMAKAKIATKTVVRDEAGKPFGVKIVFTDGRRVSVGFEELSEAILAELTAHGLSQKLGDSFSQAKGNLDYAFAECESVAEALKAGEWNRRGGGKAGQGILAEAIARLTGKDVAEVTALLAAKDDEARKALRKDPRVAAEIKAIELERAKAKAAKAEGSDLNGLLGGEV